MIVGPDWVWLHVPKCAGTATEYALREAFANLPDVVFDPVGPGNPVIWHHTVAKRTEQDPSFSAQNKRIAGNIRRLPFWLLSRAHFEVWRHGNKVAPTRQQLLRGLFPNVSLKGEVVRHISADHQIAHFADEVTHWFRTEFLKEDLQSFFDFPEELGAVTPVSRNETKLRYVNSLDFWFTPDELAGLYDANPLWAAIERKVYGSVLTL